MKSFKTFFTAIAATLILCGTAFAVDLSGTIGKAPPAVTEAQATEPTVEAKGPDYRVVISSDFGGGVIDYIKKYNTLRQDGSKVRIDDLCMSACTMVTGLVPDANVCVSPYAIMAFHSAWMMTFTGPMHSKDGTALLWNIYPDRVQEKLKARGWDGTDGINPHPEFIYFKGTDFYPLCN